MKYFIILMVVLSMGLVSASEGIDISIKNNTLNVKGYVMSDTYGKVSASFFEDINQTFNQSIICDTETITCNGTNETITTQKNCRLNIDFQTSKPFNFNQTVGTIIGDAGMQLKYEKCIEEKISHSIGLTNCVKDKEKLVDYEQNYTDCKNQLNTCTSQKNSLTTEKSACEKEAEEKKNDRWLWGVGGLILGAVIILYREGKILQPKAKQPEDSYNRQQGG